MTEGPTGTMCSVLRHSLLDGGEHNRGNCEADVAAPAVVTGLGGTLRTQKQEPENCETRRI
jgi:hypothetical protein